MTLSVRRISVSVATMPVVRDVSVDVARGELVALVGPNGAGKTTLVRGILGTRPVVDGEVWVDDERIDTCATHRRARGAKPGAGVGCVPEGRELFPGLTVRQHILLAARRGDANAVEEVLGVFPMLEEHLDRRVGELSGGQQQMVAVGRAMALRPGYLILDEPSLGLAPQLVHDLARTLQSLRDRELGVLVADQNIAISLAVADRVVVLARGELIDVGTPAEVRARRSLDRAYQQGGVMNHTHGQVVR